MLAHLDVSRRVLAYQGFGNQKRDLGQRSGIQVFLIIILCEVEARIILPAFEVDEDVVILKGSTGTNAQIVALPTHLVRIQQIYNGWPIQASTSNSIGSVTACGSCHESQAVRCGWTEQRTEVVATQGEMIGQSIVVREVRAVIVGQ